MANLINSLLSRAVQRMENISGDQVFTWGGTDYACIWSEVESEISMQMGGFVDSRSVRIIVRQSLFTGGSPVPSIDIGSESYTVPVTGDMTTIFGDRTTISGDMTEITVTTDANAPQMGHPITLDGDEYIITKAEKPMTGSHYILHAEHSRQ